MNFLLRIIILLMGLSAQTFLVCAEKEKPKEQIERSPALQRSPSLPKLRDSVIDKHVRAGSWISPRTGDARSPRRSEQSPRKDGLRTSQTGTMGNKEENVYEAIQGKYSGKTFTIVGTCMEIWKVASLTDIVERMPGLFENPSVQDYCDYLGLKADSIKEAKQKVISSKDLRVKELFVICKQAQQAGFGSMELIALHQQDLKKVIKEVKK